MIKIYQCIENKMCLLNFWHCVKQGQKVLAFYFNSAALFQKFSLIRTKYLFSKSINSTKSKHFCWFHPKRTSWVFAVDKKYLKKEKNPVLHIKTLSYGFPYNEFTLELLNRSSFFKKRYFLLYLQSSSFKITTLFWQNSPIRSFSFRRFQRCYFHTNVNVQRFSVMYRKLFFHLLVLFHRI